MLPPNAIADNDWQTTTDVLLDFCFHTCTWPGKCLVDNMTDF